MDKKNTLELLAYILVSLELIDQRFESITCSDDFKWR